MSSPKDKVSVDEKLADVIREYYRVTSPDEDISPLCFSNPQIHSHVCNKLELAEGKTKCKSCNHDPQKICDYSCDISKACLAAFAYRLGLGASDPIKSIKQHLQLDYKDLVDKIYKALRASGDEMPELKAAEGVDVSVLEEVVEVPVEEVVEVPVSAPVVAEAAVAEASVEAPVSAKTEVSEYVSVAEAAELLGCTPPNVYGLIKRGSLIPVIHPKTKKKQILRSEVLARIKD